MTARTIARTATKQIAAAKAAVTSARVYTLDNYFIGRDIDPVCAWEVLDKGRGKLLDNGSGSYTIRVHSNCWYELR